MKGFKGVVEVGTTEGELEESPSVPSFPSKVSKNLLNILTTLKKGDGSLLVTKGEAINLSSLTLENGEQLLSLNQRWFLYEVTWMLNRVGYETTYNFLSRNWEKVLGSDNLREKMLFENPLMEKTKEKFALDMEIYRSKPDVLVGLEKCKKCGSESTVSLEKQQRSSDEAMTIKVICLQCNFRWSAQ